MNLPPQSSHRVRKTLGAVLLAFSLLAHGAAAQCTMCAKNAEFAGGDSGSSWSSLFTGALVLLVPVIGVLTGAFCLIWRFRNADGLTRDAAEPGWR